MTMIERALMLLDRPYIWGGDGTGSKYYGFDCSGLVLECLYCAGLYEGRDLTAEGIREWCSAKHWTKLKKPREGALLFFGKGKKATHVAIALGENLMIEAGGGDSVCLNPLKSTGCVRIRPVSRRLDFLEGYIKL